ncbi:TonB-dependent receptor [Sphingomonas hengshuiensis]|uniref:TonB-dependent receptor n=1 Tax=Sphingomonas hengshuiensis TaxID=1609977 RepID=A0A7U5BEE1_9SPHN|nr:TonB-dependent receptor [Sphingomonas hengshuiensis]AJP70765.1 hypothetical protein TS85_01375 [Sphingomonas hengshuiensis]
MRIRIKTLLAVTSASIALLPGLAQAQQAASADDADAEIVVTGQRAAQKTAIETKKKSDVIMDSVSADEAGKLPDNSVTEVLQRVVGVNITRIQTGGSSENYLGEGTGLTVRGLDKIVSQLNGRDSFSAASGRNLAWEDIPPELAQGVDVNKSASADLPEGGFGGTVNLRTRQPFDFKGRTINASIDANYADYAQKAHPGGNILLSDRWTTPIGEFGLLINAAYSDLATKADGVQVSPYFPQVYNPSFTSTNETRLPYLGDAGSTEVYVPGGVNFNQNEYDRKRLGLYAAAQYRPNDRLTFFLTGFRSEYRLKSVLHSMYADTSGVTVLSPNSTNTFDENGGLTSTTGLSSFLYIAPSGSGSAVGLGTASGWAYQPMPYVFQTSQSVQKNVTSDISFGADWDPSDRLKFKFAYQYVDSTSTSSDKAAYAYAYLPGYGLTLGSYGSSALPQVTLSSQTPDLTNAANYGWLATMDHLRDDRGHEHAGYIDGSYILGDGLFRSIKFGAKVTFRRERDNETLWNYKALTPPFGVGINSDGQYQALSSFSPPAFSYLSTSNSAWSELFNLGSLFHGQTSLPSSAYFPSLALLNTDFGTVHSAIGAPGDTTETVTYQPGSLSTQREDTQAVYALTNFRSEANGFMPFRGNIGVRLVHYDYYSSGSVISLGFPTPVSLMPVTGYVAPGAEGSIVNNGQYQGNTVQFTSADTAIPNAGGRSGFMALPSLNILLEPMAEVQVRLAASKGMSRPTFAQLNPRGSLYGTYAGTYVSHFSGNQGNPNLKPETAEQFDASFEWYPGSGGLVHLAAFYKRIHNYISTQAVTVPYTLETYVSGGVAGTVNGQGNAGCASVVYGAYCPQTVNAVMIQPFNETEVATIKGLEFGLQKYATFLPGPFDGLGVNFNYTYIDSHQPGALAYDIKGNRINGLPLTGLSKNTLNLAMLYDKGPLSLRVAYNWRDSFLVSTAAYQTSGSYNYINDLAPVNGQTAGQQGTVITYALPVFQYPSGTLDVNFSYKISDNVTWVVQGANLTQPTVRLYMGTGTGRYNRSWYTSDRRYTTSIRITL